MNYAHGNKPWTTPSKQDMRGGMAMDQTLVESIVIISHGYEAQASLLKRLIKPTSRKYALSLRMKARVMQLLTGLCLLLARSLITVRLMDSLILHQSSEGAKKTKVV